jgi:hypothetical protein
LQYLPLKVFEKSFVLIEKKVQEPGAHPSEILPTGLDILVKCCDLGYN